MNHPLTDEILFTFIKSLSNEIESIFTCPPDSYFCTTLLRAQEEPGVSELGDTLILNVDLFEETRPMVMTLTFDLKKYQREKYKEGYLPVDLLFHVNDTLDVRKTARIKSRGEFRKNHCSFAPFWLNIRKSQVANPYLQKVTKMKVVTHCRESNSYEMYVLKEYLAYKIYNILSPVSFRTGLIRMKYVDTGRKNKVSEGWAFIIEPEEMLAERHNALVIKNDALGMVLMRPDEMLLLAFFEYLIGNADYSVTGRHNVKILGQPGFGSEGYTPVPYDFDYSGIVNASYAVPGENLGIKSVTERYYMGPCRDDEQYLATIRYMEDFREEILALVRDFPYLLEKDKQEMISYIESFYKEVSNPRFISNKLRQTCR